jgi:hypothetical protein
VRVLVYLPLMRGVIVVVSTVLAGMEVVVHLPLTIVLVGVFAFMNMLVVVRMGVFVLSFHLAPPKHMGQSETRFCQNVIRSAPKSRG